MTIRLYLDEDTSDADLFEALRIRSVDVIAAAPSGMGGRTDDDQLKWTTQQQRVLYSFNRGDFCRIHSALMGAGQSHGGIILAAQQRYSVGEQMRRLVRLISSLTAEEMRNRIEFLGAWT
jgi:Domain of unknown function (DUF5615)